MNIPCTSQHSSLATVFVAAAVFFSHCWCRHLVYADAPQRVPGTHFKPWRVIKYKPFGAMALAFSPNGRTLAVGTGAGSLRLWDVHTGKPLRTLQEKGNRISAIAFSPDGKLLASGDDFLKGPGTVTIWNAASGRAVRSWRAEGSLWVRFVGFAPDNKTLVTGWYAGAIHTFHFEPTSVQRQGNSITVHYDDVKGEVTDSWGDSDFPCEVRLYNIQTGALQSMFKIDRKKDLGNLTSMVYVPGVAVTMSPDIVLRDIHSGKELRRIGGWGDQVLAISRDGKQLAAGSSFERIRLWDLTSGKKLPRIHVPGWNVEAVAFSPDGRILAGGTHNRAKPNDFKMPGHVYLWSTRTRKLLRVLKGHSSYVRTLAFLPDGKLLASGSSNEVILWHIK